MCYQEYFWGVKYHFCLAFLQTELKIPTFHYLAKQQHYIQFHRFSCNASSVDSFSLFLMFGLTLYLPRLAVPGSSHEPRRHPPPERETPRGGGQLPARAAAQTRRLHHTVQPSQAAEHHEEAGTGNETQQQTLNCLTKIAWILSDSSTASTQVCFKALCGKQEVREVFWSLLQTCSVTSLGSLWRRTPLTPLLCVFYNVIAAPEGALSERRSTGWCHWKVWNWTYQNSGAVSDFRLACGCCQVVAGRPETKAPWSPPGGWLYTISLGW